MNRKANDSLKNKKGFTLIETVICLAILAALTLGFMYVTTGAMNINRKVHAYDKANSVNISNLESMQAKIPSDMETEKAGEEVSVNMGQANGVIGDSSGEKITLYGYSLKGKDTADSNAAYGYYSAGELTPN